MKKVRENLVENRIDFVIKFRIIKLWRILCRNLRKLESVREKSCAFREITMRLEDFKKIFRFLSKSLEKIEFIHYFYKIIHLFLPSHRNYIPLRIGDEFSNIIYPTSQRRPSSYTRRNWPPHYRRVLRDVKLSIENLNKMA